MKPLLCSKNTINECLEINKYTIKAVCLMMTKSSDQQYEEIIKQMANIPIAERQSAIDKIFSTYTPLIDELTSKIVEITKQMQELNFILIEIVTIPEPTSVGAVYVPPESISPFQLFTKCRNKPFYIFGDFNAKHTDWGCERNNVSGNQIVSWLELTGNEMIIPDKPTS
ncbi:unnamed protein product [Rotaria sp. Silwood2]|nr:unnamed protein product [Rotaria sp. Silwood2]CAF4185774.1 unnamed protein product [Rotaria sp. Silwood2]